MRKTSPPARQPANGKSAFPIVGLGASAGGLKAFGEFFSALPADPGMAFVLVQHLAPDHKSILCDLIRRYTRMEVFEVENGMPVQINRVYIIPPNHDMALLNGTLQLIEPLAPHGQRLPVDYFFRSLAQDQHEQAIGIVLSGTASDGTLGVSAIKGEGGMVMAQSPDSAEFDGMPRSAIATGLIDYELPAGELPAKLMTYAAHAFHNRVCLTAAPTAETKADDALKKIFILLRSFTGHDFSQYKLSTIRRRIERRMAVQEIKRLDDYVRFLQQTPTEGITLFRELLIGVTNFFRDPEAFSFLEEQGIPRLFEGKPRGSTIRVWSAGCSTGEEAYSLAILLQERMEALGQSHNLQLFATDIDSRAIATARAARYPTSIAADITPERLTRFFTPEPDGTAYRVHKRIRDLLIFSEHDLIKDPPFSKLDLVSCRNLLIYLDADLQKRLIPLFHYTMNPEGLLFLGMSETVGGFDDFFAPLDRRAKLYRRKENRSGAWRPMDLLVPPQHVLNADHPQFVETAAPAAKLSPRELTEKAMVRQIVQASVLVTERGEILYIHGRTGRYLELAPGDGGISNVLKTAREGLGHELTMALHKAARNKEVVVSPGVRVKTNGSFTTINLTVSPVLAEPSAMPEAPLYLVILEEAPKEPKGSAGSGHGTEVRGRKADARVVALNKKLQEKEEYLQSSMEELESSTEELKSANEEMQSVNEELQSANEELETAKEELQSSNEELHTVNNELQSKVVDLAQNDINNLLAGTGVGTLFVDRHLCILRFTPPIVEIINVVSDDVGRPLRDFALRLRKYSTLEEDIRAVLDSLIPAEREVQSTQDKWYLLRILPYRTTENVIEGAVLSFLDITEHKRGELVSDRLAAIIRSSNDAIISKDLNGIVTSWNQGAEKLFGYISAEMVGASIRRLIPAGRCQEEQALLEKIKGGGSVDIVETLRQAKDGKLRDVSLTVSPIRDADGTVVGASTVARDITEKKQSLQTLNRMAVVVHDAHDAITVQDLDGRTLAWNPGAVRMYGWNEVEALLLNVRDRIPQELREGALDTLVRLSRAEILEPYRTQRLTKDGKVKEVSIISSALLSEAGEMYAIATTERVIARGAP